MRYHIYLQNNDEDICLLLQTAKLAVLTRLAVRAEIRGERISIPLPKMPTTLTQPKGLTLRLDDAEDEDVIRWLDAIKPGCISTVIKLLLRRATETADIRMFLKETEVRVQTAKNKSAPRRKEEKPANKQPDIEEGEKTGYTLKEIALPTAGGEDNEYKDMFDMI